MRCKALKTAELSEGLEKIGARAFSETNLKSIVLPKSLNTIKDLAFMSCHNLESVTFNSAPKFGEMVFVDCFKLPADVTLIGLVNSCNISRAFKACAFYNAFYNGELPIWKVNEHLKYTRPDVLELAVKNDCFRSVDTTVMLKFLIKKGDAESLRAVEECGLLDKRRFVDALIKKSVERGETELTAYLLDLKNREFGFANFEGGNELGL